MAEKISAKSVIGNCTKKESKIEIMLQKHGQSEKIYVKIAQKKWQFKQMYIKIALLHFVKG